LQVLTAPRFYGLEHAPADRPVMVVANHTVMGVLDVPFLVLELYERRGVFLRALGDHLHFQVPLWRDPSRRDPAAGRRARSAATSAAVLLPRRPPDRDRRARRPPARRRGLLRAARARSARVMRGIRLLRAESAHDPDRALRARLLHEIGALAAGGAAAGPKGRQRTPRRRASG
jgi:hypothetical protein